MTELDLSAAVRAVITGIAGTTAQQLALSAVKIAAPIIARATRELVAAELAAWADEIPADERRTGPRATRYRTLMAAARRAGPKMTTEDVAEAIKAGNFAVCHLDEAGRAIARGGDEASRG